MKVNFFFKECFTLLLLFFTSILLAQPTPPEGKQWEKIEIMSDEFNNGFNDTKWAKNDPQWAGRVPGKFKTNAVTVSNGKLKITNYLLPSPEGNYTHGCGLVRSKTRNTYGYYETRMKGNKTFMSSTFWLINKRNEFTGCDFRTTELDVTETVGYNSGNKPWINNFISSMNSNTHSRGTSCASTPVGIRGGNQGLGEESWRDYHTYGVWWKSKNEILFYLDGVYRYTVVPAADFDLAMYLRMVTETYDFNPVPPGPAQGMGGSVEDRTTYYDWVRSYKLVDGTTDGNPDSGPESVTLNNISDQQESNEYTFTVNYTASQQRDVQVEVRAPNNDWLGLGKVTVNSGSGVVEVSVNLNTTAAVGDGYKATTLLVPVGANWQQQIDNDDKLFNVTDGSSGPESVTLNDIPDQQASNEYTFSVNYSASQQRDVQVEIRDPDNNWLALGKVTVNSGSGVANVTVNLNATAVIGDDYKATTLLVPVGANWQQQIDNDYKLFNVVGAVSEGNIFYLVNRQTGRKLRPQNNTNGAAMIQVDGSQTGNVTKWEQVNTSNEYFYLKNVESGMYFRPATDDDGAALVQRPTNYSGNYTQWRKVTSSNAYFYLQNRATGKYFRPQWDGNNSPIEQRPTSWSGNYTQWKFENAGTRAIDKSDLIVTAYENPTQLDINTPDNGEVFIEVFDLSGQTVLSQKIGVYSDKTVVLLPGVDKGLHIVQVTYNGKTKSVKIVNR